VPTVGTSVDPETVTSETIHVEVKATEKKKIPVVAESDNALVDNSKASEVSESLSEGKEVSDSEVVIMGDNVTKVSDTGVAKRTRSRAGKGVTTVSTPVQ
ncbi:hypothetical protein A2U01_0072335, partial [Trifolium medium]|nr:hypothetical protein [Trifolium medium]